MWRSRKLWHAVAKGIAEKRPAMVMRLLQETPFIAPMQKHKWTSASVLTGVMEDGEGVKRHVERSERRIKQFRRLFN